MSIVFQMLQLGIPSHDTPLLLIGVNRFFPTLQCQQYIDVTKNTKQSQQASLALNYYLIHIYRVLLFSSSVSLFLPPRQPLDPKNSSQSQHNIGYKK